MAQILVVTDQVLTGDGLRQQHRGEDVVQVASRTVLTPSAWDFVRQQRLEVVRGEVSAAAAQPEPAAMPMAGTAAGPDAVPAVVGAAIREVVPQMIAAGRCDHPDRAFGCRTEEFGSGFAEPVSCLECAVFRLRHQGQQAPACVGCNREHAVPVGEPVEADLEALVQRLTDLVLAQLTSGT
jgi:hypothetical protein